MLTGSIERLVVRKSSGMVLGILGIMLFFLADSWFIALLGTEALAAMSFIMPVSFIVTSLAMGMGVGMSAIVGRMLGAQETQYARRFISDSLLLTVVLVGALATMGYLSIDWLFLSLGAEASIMPYITEYMQIWYIGVLFLVIPMVGNAAIRASGNMRLPATVMLISGALNAILDPIFMFSLGLGIKGAALASAVAWVLTFVVSIRVLHVKLHFIDWRWPGLSALLTNWGTMLKMGIPSAASQMLNPIAQTIIVSVLANFGLFGVAALGFAMRVESVVLIVGMALSTIVPTVFGQNYGAKQWHRASHSIRYSLKLALIFYLGIYFLLWPTAPYIARFFSEQQEVIEIATSYLRILPLSYALLSISSITSSLLTALHRPISSLLFNIVRLFGFVIPAVYFGAQWAGVMGVFWGLCLSTGIFGLGAYVYTLRLLRQVEGAA